MTNMNDRNLRVIEEFRTSDGKVGGGFSGAPMLLLSTLGAKTAQLRTNPLVYLPDGDRWIIFASKGGAQANPDWFHNIVANPVVTLEIGAEAFEAYAEVIRGEERDNLYARQMELYPQFGEYERRTTRKIPVIALTRERRRQVS